MLPNLLVVVAVILVLVSNAHAQETASSRIKKVVILMLENR